MTEKTKRILEIISAQNGITAEEVEQEIMEAIRAGMASSNPHAQALWKQMCPDGKEPDLDTFLTFMANRGGMVANGQKPKKNGQRFFS